MTEPVNHPAHYGGENDLYEAIKVIEAWSLGFCLGNTVKYIARAGKKGDRLEDLRKARWYLDREIERDNEPALCTILDHPEDPHFCRGTDGYTYDPIVAKNYREAKNVINDRCLSQTRKLSEPPHECGPAC